MKRLLWPLLVLSLVAAACSSGGSGASDDDDDAATTPTGTATPAGTPSFATHIIPILEASCGAANNACHSRVAYGANSSTVGGACRGWLSLENAPLGSQLYAPPADAGNPTGCPDKPLYDRLTEAGLSNAWQCGPNTFDQSNPNPNVPYVVPGDPDASYLYRKINGGPYCGTPSDPMPQTGVFSAVDKDIIRRWIEGGAPQ